MIDEKRLAEIEAAPLAWFKKLRHMKGGLAQFLEIIREVRRLRSEVDGLKAGQFIKHLDSTAVSDAAEITKMYEASQAEVRRLREALEKRDNDWAVALAFAFKDEGYERSPIVPEVDAVRECLRTRKDSSKP